MCSLEEARMCAARDGNIAHYSYWSAYQAWCYLMAGYLDREDLFTKDECIKWAEKLVKEAKSSYSYIGKICYQQIKQNAGKTIEDSESPNKTIEIDGKYYELYGDVYIEFMPFINETSDTDQIKDGNPKMLVSRIFRAGLKTKNQALVNKVFRKSKSGARINKDTNPKILDIDLSILKKENEFPSRYLFGVHSSIILFSMGMLELCKKDGLDEKSIEYQKKCIEDAKKMFIFCSAIAEEGGNENHKVVTRELSKKEKKFDDHFSEFDSHIKILYPHRLTQFSDLGKIFAATCYAILNYGEEDKDKQKYNKLKERLLDQLGKNPKIDENSKEDKSDDNQSYDNDRILGQTEFNGHLETHIRDIQQYFEVYFESLPKNEDLSVVRDKVVTDIFKIIRGESVRG